MSDDNGIKRRLSDDGLHLRARIAEAGFEVTPDQLADGLEEAEERIGFGPCRFCGEEKELRFGGCFQCVIGESNGR